MPEKATTMKAYVKSKTLAERAAWDFCKENGMQLAVCGVVWQTFTPMHPLTWMAQTILPVLVIGPVLSSYSVPGSMQSIFKLMNGSLPLVPNLEWSTVVRGQCVGCTTALRARPASNQPIYDSMYTM